MLDDFFDESGDWGRSHAIEKPTKRDFIKRSPVHCHAPCMIRREAYLAVNGYTEDKRMLRFEDVDLWYKLYAKGYVGYNFDEYALRHYNYLKILNRTTVFVNGGGNLGILWPDI